MITPPNANGGGNNETFDLPTIETKALASPISIYPNPAKEVIYLKQMGNTDVETEVALTNATGNTVLTEKISSTTEPIDVAQVPAGIYFLRVWQGGKCLATEKVVIHK